MSQLQTQQLMTSQIRSHIEYLIADTLATKWLHVNHRSEKVRQPKTDVLTTKPRRPPLIIISGVSII